VTLVGGFPVDDASPGEHIQHVTIPPSVTTTASNSHIQRVPSVQTTGSESTTEARPFQQAVESGSEASTEHVEETTLSEAASEDDVTTDAVVFDVEGEAGVVLISQPREDLKMPEDDLVTANFWWGLGPVYPHLYQFKRVPHLVPIHSFNPYHDYYAYHKKYPRQYSF